MLLSHSFYRGGNWGPQGPHPRWRSGCSSPVWTRRGHLISETAAGLRGKGGLPRPGEARELTDPAPQPGPGTAHRAVPGAALLGRQGIPAAARVLSGAGLAEPALLHAWLPVHGYLQRHDPEGERQGQPRAARLAELDTAPQGHSFWAQQAGSPSVSIRAHIQAALHTGKHICTCVLASVHTGARASLLAEVAGTKHRSSPVCLCPGSSGHVEVPAFIQSFNKHLGSGC